MKLSRAKEKILNYIYSKIIDDSLKTEEKIPQETICKDLHMSRTPIREALIELASEGVLERKANRGFWLRKLDLEDIKEVYSVIGCLEGHAASIASDKLSREDFALLRKLIDLIDKSIAKKSYNNYYSQQLEFHNIIVRASNNKKLIEIVTSLKNLYISRVHYVFHAQDNLFEVLQKSNDEHKLILKLLIEGDKTRLESYFKDVHWKISRAVIFSPQTKKKVMYGNLSSF